MSEAQYCFIRTQAPQPGWDLRHDGILPGAVAQPNKDTAMTMTQPNDDAFASLLDLNAALNELLLEMHHLLLLLCDERARHDGPALAAIRILANDVIARARRCA